MGPRASVAQPIVGCWHALYAVPVGRVTLADVARAAGVHPGTASRALHGEALGQVSSRTIQRVRDAARRLGHRRIAHVAGPQALSTGQARLEAFRLAMQRHGAAADPALIAVAGAFTIEAGAEAVRLLPAGLDAPTAILAANDLLAIGCYEALAERGLAVPGDVSVVGFNDMLLVDKLTPPLTTVRVSQV